jgi:hypothetical protein
MSSDDVICSGLGLKSERVKDGRHFQEITKSDATRTKVERF